MMQDIRLVPIKMCQPGYRDLAIFLFGKVTMPAWTEDDKQKAATELMNALQNIKELGPFAEARDFNRLGRAKSNYRKITGRKP